MGYKIGRWYRLTPHTMGGSLVSAEQVVFELLAYIYFCSYGPEVQP